MNNNLHERLKQLPRRHFESARPSRESDWQIVGWEPGLLHLQRW